MDKIDGIQEKKCRWVRREELLKALWDFNELSLASVSFWRYWKLINDGFLKMCTLCLHLDVDITCNLKYQSCGKSLL